MSGRVTRPGRRAGSESKRSAQAQRAQQSAGQAASGPGAGDTAAQLAQVAELLAALREGRCRIAVPEEGALAVVACLLERGAELADRVPQDPGGLDPQAGPQAHQTVLQGEEGRLGVVGLVQALVFTLLTAVFTLLICTHDESRDHAEEAH